MYLNTPSQTGGNLLEKHKLKIMNRAEIQWQQQKVLVNCFCQNYPLT